MLGPLSLSLVNPPCFAFVHICPTFIAFVRTDFVHSFILFVTADFVHFILLVRTDFIYSFICAGYYDGDGLDKSQIGIALHSGKNRIVRRIFESLGYEVNKLDRVIFAGLTKKDLPRGKWRNLSEMEVNMLKMVAGTR